MLLTDKQSNQLYDKDTDNNTSGTLYSSKSGNTSVISDSIKSIPSPMEKHTNFSSNQLPASLQRKQQFN
jgi:hypothetical protein